ncbi:MAG: hypothetical protein ACM3MF_08265, partial [Anaerolineae bacterium]
HYTIVVTNDGNVTLSAVTVTDANADGLLCTPANGSSLAPGASMTCTASHTITQLDIDAGSFYNQACVDDGPSGADSKCADVTTPGTQNPHLTITKVATENTYSAVGDVIHYTIVVKNDGNTTLGAVTVTDPNADGLVCTPVNGSALGAGQTMTCTASHTITQADIDAGSYYNQACVDDGPLGAPQACDDKTTTGEQNPHLSISKEAAESSYSAVGQIIHYTIVATNDGNTTLAAVTVTDANASGLVCTPANGSALAPGASMTCTASHTVTQADIDAGSYYNQACVDDGAGGADSQCDDVTTPAIQNPHLAIIKTATETSFDTVGQVIHYSIAVTNDGNTTLAAVTVSDPNALGLTCTPANGSSLAPGASMNCTASHTITQADIDAGSYYNQACVDDGPGGADSKCSSVTTPGTQAPAIDLVKSGAWVDANNNSLADVGEEIAYTFTVTNIGNVTLYNIELVDLDMGVTVDGGPIGSLAPGQSDSSTFTATYILTQADLDAGHFHNTAIACGSSPTSNPVCDQDEHNVVFPPRLIVIKHVINNNGGSKAAGDFTMQVTGTNVNPASFAGSEAGISVALDAGTYSVGEDAVAGYALSSAGDCSGSIAAGQTKTCTLTNNDIAPVLHLRKLLMNNNGGTATIADFTLNADGTGTNDLSGSSSVDSGAGLQADTWALSESGPAGYAASAWSCTGTGSQNGSSITVGIGQEATCTITNDDIAPKLHLRKTVVNDNGGTKTVADFTLTANGTGSNDLSGTSPVDSGAGLQADTWALSETNVYGYTASAWSCVGGTQSGSNITVGIGGEATCTITNNDQPGTIVIKKITKPANTGSFAFTTTGTGYTSFTIPGGGMNSQTLNAGTYTVKESTQLGWILTGIGQDPADPNNPLACAVTGAGGSTGTGDLNTMSASINLKNGDTVTCVFENTGQGTTRTQGFWATHPQLANIAWFGGTAFGHTFPGVAGTAGIGNQTLCGRPIDTLGKLMGGFWSDVSKTSTGRKRSSLDQARMQLLQQLLAAELNASAFGSVPSNGSFAAWEAAYCGTNQNAIKTAQQQAASFNSAGDSQTFTPGTSADSKNARAIATLTFWDVLP